MTTGQKKKGQERTKLKKIKWHVKTEWKRKTREREIEEEKRRGQIQGNRVEYTNLKATEK